MRTTVQTVGRTRRQRRAAATSALALILAALFPAHAMAAESVNMSALLFPDSDVIYNYDFSTNVGASYQTVDWGTTLLFYNNASVNQVKNDRAVVFSYPATGGRMYGWVDDGTQTCPGCGYRTPRGFYDSDLGIKNDFGTCFGGTRHFRIYADEDDRLYNVSYGYWVYATTHTDFNELCSAYHGDAEGTEDDVGNRFANDGHAVYRDYASFFNYEPYHIDRLDSKHRWDSDGRATYINVPG